MNCQIIDELSLAMKSNPSLTVLEVITMATELVFPTRVYRPSEYRNMEIFTLSNGDILHALKKYNAMRSSETVEGESYD